jgi:hypothetical protein
MAVRQKENLFRPLPVPDVAALAAGKQFDAGIATASPVIVHVGFMPSAIGRDRLVNNADLGAGNSQSFMKGCVHHAPPRRSRRISQSASCKGITPQQYPPTINALVAARMLELTP